VITKILPSTKPLIEGCYPTKANLRIMDYCHEHDLDIEKATINDDGNLILKTDLTVKE